MTREEALAVVAQWMRPHLGPQAQLEQSYETWLRTLFGPMLEDKLGNPIPLAPHHHQIWEWLWNIRLGYKQDPMVAILPRGGGKSTTAELGVVSLAARRV